MAIKIQNCRRESPLREWSAQIHDMGGTAAAVYSASSYTSHFIVPYKCRLDRMYWTNGATDFSGSNGVAIHVEALATSQSLVAGALHSQSNAVHGGGEDWTANGCLLVNRVDTGITTFNSDLWNTAGTMFEVQISGTLVLNGIGAVAVFEISTDER